jgi:RNA polymerase sigma-70 factor (ECF subfamily)
VRTLSHPEISAEVIQACRQGDRDAFRVLYETYKDKVYSIALYYFHGDADMARDATQQAFLKAMTGIAQFRGDSGFSTWLYRLVVNTCRDRSRSAASREMSSDPADLAHVGRPASHEDDLARAQESVRVRAALSSLPPKLRMPVLLRYFDDLSYGQLAAALDCSIGTVASRLNRGHQILRQKLQSLRGAAAAQR